jgi:hypothetical protein
MAATNKRLLISESRGDSNRCTPCRGKPDQHDMYASHASPRTPGVCFLRAVPVRGNLSWVVNRVRRMHCSREKSAPNSTSQPGWVIRRTCLSFSPNTTIEAVRLSQAPVGGRLLGLPGPYHRYAIGTFNTFSRVSTPRSLTDAVGGYHIESLRIATTLSPPFASEGSTDPLMTPPDLRLSPPHFTTRIGEGNKR